MKYLDEKREQVDDAMAELERLIFDLERSYEDAIAEANSISEWEDEEG